MIALQLARLPANARVGRVKVADCASGSHSSSRRGNHLARYECAQYLGRGLFSGRVLTLIEARANNEIGAVGRISDEVDDRLKRSQRTTTPVDRDEREQSVFAQAPGLPNSGSG